MDDVHGYVARAILDTFKHYRKTKELPPAAFLAQAIKFIEKTDSTAPTRNVGKGQDRLAGLLAGYDPHEDMDGTGKADKSVDFTQRDYPESSD